MTNHHTCKKCGRKLPTNYKYKKCESCRNKDIDRIKKITGVIMAAGTAISFIGKNIFGGKR